MSRIQRMIIPDEETVYHIMSRTALDGLPFRDIEKDKMVEIIRRFSRVYFVEIMGFCIMDNHFHLVARMHLETSYSDSDIRDRYVAFYGSDDEFTKELIPHYRKRWSSLSEFVKDIKQNFSRYYNKMHDRKGTLWGERFKSLIVQDGATLINCLAYVDLNPLRAGIVERPDDYRWNSLGYHIQQGNRDGFLSLDFGLVEFGVLDAKERLKRFRRHVYEAGAVNRSDKGFVEVIDSKIVEKERARDFNISTIRRFRYKTRYFSDSGVIGTKAFVSKTYHRFKHYFQSKEKKPKPIKGLQGIYSMKRLSEPA